MQTEILACIYIVDLLKTLSGVHMQLNFYKNLEFSPFKLVLRHASLKGLRLWNLQENVSPMLSLIREFVSRLSHSEQGTVKGVL